MKINPFSPPEAMERDKQFGSRPRRKKRDRTEQIIIAFLAVNAMIVLVAVIAASYSFFRVL